MAEVSQSRIIRFGQFELDAQAGELRKNGVRLRLQQQPFQVLAELLANAGRIVTREELQRKLWPADTFVDFDVGLNTAIRKLRQTLDDDADHPRYIETVAKRGYRFIAPVSPSNGSTPAMAVDNSTPLPTETTTALELPPLPPRTHFRWLVVALIGAVVGAGGALAIWRYTSRPAEIRERRLTTNSSDNPVDSAAISPDGKYLAYSDTTGLYLKLLQTGETHAWPLPKDFSAHIDSWFPDSAHVLIDHVETAGAQPSLWTASVLGGEPRKVADDAEAGVVSPDGSYIAFTRVPQGREEIWVMRTDGMEQTKVVPAVRDDYLGRTTWSSDGRKIAYVRRRLTGYMQTTDTIEVNEWRNGHSHILLSQERLGFALLWLPDSRIVYTRAEDVPSERDLNAWAVTVDKSGRVSGAPRRLMRGIGSIAEITADADGRLMVFRRIQQQNQVVAGTLSPDGRRLVGTKRLTLDENQNLPFAWTPDSKSVLFSSDRNGSVAIFKQAIDQPLPELLATSSEGEWTSRTIPRLTPDGSEAVYLAEPKIARSGSVSAIAAISLQGGAPRIILRGEKIGNIECARLPSTVCIYAVEVGDHATFLQFDVRSGVSSELTTIDISGGVPMNWGLSPDGSKLAIILHTPNANTIQLRSLVTGKTYDLTVKGWSGVLCVDWAADSNSLFVTTSNLARQNALLRVMLDGSASLLGEGGKNQFINWAIPSPDGRMLALNEAAGTSNVWAVEKF